MKQANRITRVICGLLLLAGASGVSASEAIKPEAIQKESAPVVGELLSRYHYNDRAAGDTLSRAVYDAYFDALDPQRYYFTRDDIRAFADRRRELDDEVENGKLDTAYAIFERYRQRVRERSDYALEILDNGLSFDGDMRFDADRTDAEWAGSMSELDAIWRKRVTNDALKQKLSGRDIAAIEESLTERYERLPGTLAQYEPEDVFQTFMSAWAGEYDPHSSYMSPRRSENFDINMRLSLEGIGALLGSEGDFVEIVELIPGGPAEGSGELGAGDRIVGVGQSPDEIEDVVGRRLADVVDLIRGPKGSEVYLQVLPPSGSGDSSQDTVALTRNTIELEEQAAKAEIREVKRDENNRRIGVIDIPTFYADIEAANAGDSDYRSTTRDVRELIESDKLEGIDGLIIDLRGNAGGALDEAVQLSGLFIDKGPIVQVHRRNGERRVLNDQAAEDAVYDGPLGVLVDGRSASASEIFAAAMQDYGRGVVMGDQTFGKGTVQTLINLDRFGVGSEDNPSGRLKLTIAKFYRINGNSTQLQGVTPDLEMPYPHGNDAMSERSADNALPWDTIQTADYRQLDRLNGLMGELRQRHERRLRQDPALVAISDEASRLRESREQTTVSLNEADRQASMDADAEERLAAINSQRSAYGLSPIDDLSALSSDTMPDVLLDESAEVIADLAELRADEGARIAGR
ncbi:carboxy terminal-processing peptidase [Spiribacter vilamensis]|uniref:S41A family C-terminal processing peptidase-1 n=1 Tax=Spiribacter vilamensis TaxID=531306 RepID=A0A4Q8CZR9_9GAMM|nr:carboxy terminal-processing peptidase [Spiribacter vilamensis]RZU98482.1 S41A family C-terminal processing peptidase-1 [Spiribacter vilamensis]TVO60648.1 peptidase S41 [Spiribacter vilamensis]